jgi:hypothetical protein
MIIYRTSLYVILHGVVNKLHEFYYSKRNIVLENIDWLVNYLLLYVPLKNISLLWRHHHCRWRAAKFRPMVSREGYFSLSCHTCCDTGPRFFFSSHPKDPTAPFNCLLLLARGCGGPFLTRILAGWPKTIAFLPILYMSRLIISNIMQAF